MWTRIAIMILGTLLGAWLAFDGSRAMIVGDYVTPANGDHAGQLGPWAGVVRAAGIEPRSNFVKGLHILIGAAWIISMASHAIGLSGSGWAVAACAVVSLWYLPFGTLVGIVVIGLLSIQFMKSP